MYVVILLVFFCADAFMRNMQTGNLCGNCKKLVEALSLNKFKPI